MVLDEILDSLNLLVEEVELLDYEDFNLDRKEIQKLEKCKNELINKIKEFYKLNGEVFQ